MPEHNSANSPANHRLQHISEVIRQKYPETAACDGDKRAHLWRLPSLINSTTATIFACIIFLVATPTAVLFLANNKRLYGLAALATALAAAFGPKIYAVFVQQKRRNHPRQTATSPSNSAPADPEMTKNP